MQELVAMPSALSSYYNISISLKILRGEKNTVDDGDIKINHLKSSESNAAWVLASEPQEPVGYRGTRMVSQGVENQTQYCWAHWTTMTLTVMT